MSVDSICSRSSRESSSNEPHGHGNGIHIRLSVIPSPVVETNNFGRNSISRATGPWGSVVGGVLGEGYNGSPGVSKKWLSGFGSLSGNSTKKKEDEFVPKNPRPSKTRVAIENLRNGLRGCVLAAQEELQSINSSLTNISHNPNNQGRVYTMEKCVGYSERYLKGVSYRMSLVDSLAEEYTLGERLREGVRGMAYAYSVSSGPEKDNALANVKAGFKECTEALCAIEAKLQKILGVFDMEIKGIQGFSRLMGGDVFEICLRHGSQKWKSRGRVCKDGKQNWDVPHGSFRGVLGELIHIKAAEVKTLGKEVLLGNKFCEITELFSPHPQLMTVNLNPTGSLKLSLLVQWRPLGNGDDSFGTIIGTTSRLSSVSPNRKRRLSQQFQIDPLNVNLSKSNSSTLSSSASNSNQSDPDVDVDGEIDNPGSGTRDAVLWERSLENLVDSVEAPRKSPRIEEIQPAYVDPSGNFSFKNAISIRDEVDGCESVVSTELENEKMEEERHLRDAVIRLASLLEDVQGQYPELETLHRHTNSFKKLFKNSGFRSSSSSLNVESALEAFDFLDCEESPERSIPCVQRKPLQSQNELMDGRMSGRTTDSGISIGYIDSRTPSPQQHPTSTHPLLSNEWESVLHTHIISALRLMHKIGSFGPLRCGEKEALRKLQEEGTLLGQILNKPSGSFPFENNEEITSLWRKIGGDELIVEVEDAQKKLEKEIEKVLKDGNSEMKKKITNRILGQILQSFEIRPKDYLTRFQFSGYFKHQSSFIDLVQEIQEEEMLLHDLNDDSKFCEVLKSIPSSALPPKSILVFLLRRLVDSNTDKMSQLLEFLRNLSKVPSRKREIESTCVEMLESENVLERNGGCIGLGLLGGSDVVEVLAYSAQMDHSPEVRSAANEALLQLGQDQISHQINLSTHGFQGLGLS